MPLTTEFVRDGEGSAACQPTIEPHTHASQETKHAENFADVNDIVFSLTVLRLMVRVLHCLVMVDDKTRTISVDILFMNL
jgi:hypothetical protein